MSESSVIGLDLAKDLFQRQGRAARGEVVLRTSLGRVTATWFLQHAARRPRMLEWYREAGRDAALPDSHGEG